MITDSASVADYISIFPVAQQIVGGYGFFSNAWKIGQCAKEIIEIKNEANKILKTQVSTDLSPELKVQNERLGEIYKKLKDYSLLMLVGLTRAIPIIGTIYSITHILVNSPISDEIFRRPGILDRGMIGYRGGLLYQLFG